MEKVILEVDNNNNVYDANGTMIGTLISDCERYNGIGDTTLQLVKHGVTVDEIIKLKNAELI